MSDTTFAKNFKGASSLFSLLLIIGVCAANALAQMGGIDSDPGSPGTGGRSTIEGRIYYPSGRNVDKRLKVKLTGIRGGDFFTMADDTGAFSFRRVGGGTYVVSVDPGSEYEPVNEQVDVVDGPATREASFGRTYNLQIQLRPRGANPKGGSGVFIAALGSVPKPAVNLYQKALASAQAGDRVKAIDQLRSAISIYPEFMLAYNQLGVQYLSLGLLDKAAEALRAALAIAPDAFEPLLNYGIALVYMKRVKEAEPKLRMALEKNETSGVAHYFLGRALAVSRRFDEAEKELLRAIKLSGDEVAMAHRYLGAIYNDRGDNEHAITELETYPRLVPQAKDADQCRRIVKQLQEETQRKKD